MSAKTNAKKKEQDKPQSSGLGLDGLGDLAGLLNEQPAANAGGAGPQELPLDLIDEDPHQPRTADNPGFSPESIAEIGHIKAARHRRIARIARFACHRQPEGGARRGRQRGAGGVPLAGDALQEARQQRFEAAEEAQRARHLEQQRIGQGQRDFGGKTAGPAGERFEAAPFAFGVTFLHGELRQQRPGVRQAHAGHGATAGRERIAGNDAFAGNGGARRRRRREDFERQQRKAEGQPQHGAKAQDAPCRVRAVIRGPRHGA